MQKPVSSPFVLMTGLTRTSNRARDVLNGDGMKRPPNKGNKCNRGARKHVTFPVVLMTSRFGLLTVLMTCLTAMV